MPPLGTLLCRCSHILNKNDCVWKVRPFGNCDLQQCACTTSLKHKDCNHSKSAPITSPLSSFAISSITWFKRSIYFVFRTDFGFGFAFIKELLVLLARAKQLHRCLCASAELLFTRLLTLPRTIHRIWICCFAAFAFCLQTQNLNVKVSPRFKSNGAICAVQVQKLQYLPLSSDQSVLTCKSYMWRFFLLKSVTSLVFVLCSWEVLKKKRRRRPFSFFGPQTSQKACLRVHRSFYFWKFDQLDNRTIVQMSKCPISYSPPWWVLGCFLGTQFKVSNNRRIYYVTSLTRIVTAPPRIDQYSGCPMGQLGGRDTHTNGPYVGPIRNLTRSLIGELQGRFKVSNFHFWFFLKDIWTSEHEGEWSPSQILFSAYWYCMVFILHFSCQILSWVR